MLHRSVRKADIEKCWSTSLERHLADAASGRTGGFCAPSISHGVVNAINRWPDEAETLVRLGRAKLDDMEADLATYGIEAEFECTGKLSVARTSWEADALRSMKAHYTRFGVEARLLDGADLAARLDSPRYPTGLYEPDYAFVNPAKLVHGLAQACVSRRIRICEHTKVTAVTQDGSDLRLTTPDGGVRAAQAILATNADLPLLRRLRSLIIPVFDYTIMTEPLSVDQLARIGWQDRHGLADFGNQFHYARKTATIASFGAAMMPSITTARGATRP